MVPYRVLARWNKELAMSDDRSVPHAVDTDPDDDKDLAGERLDDDFDVAGARRQDHDHRPPEERDPSEADEVVDGS
jgi:hypothetical protein